jgi:hypothetical protein
MRKNMTLPEPGRPRFARVLTLFALHAVVIYDCYILGLPMIMVMWKHWYHIALYCFALLLAFPSFFTSRHHIHREVLYLCAIGVLVAHWYGISMADDIAHNTDPLTAKNLLASSPFLICVGMQTSRLVAGLKRGVANNRLEHIC